MSVSGKGIDFLEGVGIEKQAEAFPGAKFSLAVLALKLFFAAAGLCPRAKIQEFLQLSIILTGTGRICELA
jgi:hypothetical protein